MTSSPTTIHGVPVMHMERIIHYDKRNYECPAYTGNVNLLQHNINAKVVMWRILGEKDLWFVDVYYRFDNNLQYSKSVKPSEQYWGSMKAIAFWLFNNGMYPLFDGITDVEFSMIIDDYVAHKKGKNDETKS